MAITSKKPYNSVKIFSRKKSSNSTWPILMHRLVNTKLGWMLPIRWKTKNEVNSDRGIYPAPFTGAAPHIDLFGINPHSDKTPSEIQRRKQYICKPRKLTPTKLILMNISKYSIQPELLSQKDNNPYIGNSIFTYFSSRKSSIFIHRIPLRVVSNPLSIESTIFGK